MTISQQQLAPDLWLVAADGRLDPTLTPQLEQVLGELLAEQIHNIIIDLSLATYINSGGLRCLITGRRLSRQQGGDIVLCGLNQRLSDVINMVGLDRVLIIYDTADEARGHFKG